MLERVFETTRDAERSMALNQTATTYGKYTLQQVIAFTVIFFSGGILPIIYPSYFIFGRGELVLPFGFVLPGIDYASHPGFEVNYVHHIIQVLFTCCGLCAAQNANIFFVNNVCMQLDVMVTKLKLLGREIKAKVNVDRDLQRVDFSEIIRMHVDVLE